MFKNKSLKSKILSGFLVVCFGLGVVAATGYYALDKVVSNYGNLATVSVPNLGHISGMRARGRQIHAESIKLALFWDNPEETKKTLESLAKATNRYEEITADKLKEPFSAGEEEVFKNVESRYAPVKKTTEEVLKLFKSEDPDRIAKIKTILVGFEDYVRDHQSALLKLDDYHVEMGEKWSKNAQDLSSSMTKFLISVAIATFFVGVGLAYFISKNINEILLSVAERLRLSSEKVAENSQQVADASHHLSEGTTEQAEALHETVTSTNEIAAMTTKTSDNSRESLKRAELSQQASNKGQQAIEQMLFAINEIGSSNHAINDQIKKGNSEIQEIVDLIVDIGQKTKLIDDIVFQTKLLSFNVSVEAARAGEHGKGFAVVAEEMSNLADMSGRASKEISSMLLQTTQKAMAVVESNKANVNKLLQVGDEKLHTGSQVARSCKVSLDEIIHYVDEMCTMIKETTHSTQEQAKGVSEINKAMGQIDTVTSQNAHSAKQCSEAATYLMSEVDKTRAVINDLMIVINGKVAHLNHIATVQSISKRSDKSDFDDKNFAA
jgi:methyl-accepting chemotaxis protein